MLQKTEHNVQFFDILWIIRTGIWWLQTERKMMTSQRTINQIEVIQNVTYFITIKRWFSTDHFLVKHFGIYYSCSWVRRPGMKNDDAITCIPSKMKLFKIWHVIYQSKNNSVLKDLGFYYSFTSVRGFEMKNDNVRIWKIRHYNRLMSVALYY